MVTNELEKVVSEIKQGKRIVLFPPGVAHLAFTVVLAVVGFVFLAGPAIKLFTERQPVPTVAILQLSSLLIPLIGAVIPSAMILRGRKSAALWLRRFLIASVGAGSALASYAFFVQQSQQAESIAISIGLLGVAIWLSSSAKFLLLCEFFYLLKR